MAKKTQLFHQTQLQKSHPCSWSILYMHPYQFDFWAIVWPIFRRFFNPIELPPRTCSTPSPSPNRSCPTTCACATPPRTRMRQWLRRRRWWWCRTGRCLRCPPTTPWRGWPRRRGRWSSSSLSDRDAEWFNTSWIQGDHGGLRLYFVDFDLGVPPVCSFAIPSLPNFHLPKQNWAEIGTN